MKKFFRAVAAGVIAAAMLGVPAFAESAAFDQPGWNEIDGSRYYVKADGTLATSSLVIGGVRYRFGTDGVCQGTYTGYTKSSKGKRYWKDGKPLKNRYIRVKGVRKYYADEDGYLIKIMPYVPARYDSCEGQVENRIGLGEAFSQSYAVVRARCIGLTEQTPDRRTYAFLLNESLFGGDVPARFSLTVAETEYDVESADGTYTYETADVHYEENTEYLLPLTKNFHSGALSPTANAVIELKKDGTVEKAEIQGRAIDDPERLDQAVELLPVLPKTIPYTPTENGFVEIERLRVDFDEAISQSCALVRAKCVGLTEQTREKRVYYFRTSEVYSGQTVPNGFSVTVTEGDYGVEDAPDYHTSDVLYRENTEYLLPLKKIANDRYQSTADTVIELGEGGVFVKAEIQGRKIDSPTRIDRVKKYLSDHKLSCGQADGETETPADVAGDLAGAVGGAEYILDVKIDSVFSEAEDQTTYVCVGNGILKAKDRKITSVYAMLPKDGAAVGGRYLLLLNRVSGTPFYTVSSPAFGVIPADSPTADEVRALVKE